MEEKTRKYKRYICVNGKPIAFFDLNKKRIVVGFCEKGKNDHLLLPLSRDPSGWHRKINNKHIFGFDWNCIFDCVDGIFTSLSELKDSTSGYALIPKPKLKEFAPLFLTPTINSWKSEKTKEKVNIDTAVLTDFANKLSNVENFQEFFILKDVKLLKETDFELCKDIVILTEQNIKVCSKREVGYILLDGSKIKEKMSVDFFFFFPKRE